MTDKVRIKLNQLIIPVQANYLFLYSSIADKKIPPFGS